MKNIYVYDQRKYFFFFLKRKFVKKYNFITVDNFELFDLIDFTFLNSGNVAIFIAYDIVDLFAFYRFQKYFSKNILVCSEKKDVSDLFKKKYKIDCIDISRPKKLFYQDLTDNIEILFLNEKIIV